MAVQKYVVNLSRVETTKLEEIIDNEAPATRRIKRAKIMLECDRGQSVAKIAYRIGVGHSTVERVRQRCAEAGVDKALQEKPRPGIRPKLDGKRRALVIALVCSPAPDGQEHWTMQLLADKLVELGVVELAVSHDTIGRVLKKMNSNPGRKNNGVFPK